jgi:hypothetical protein
LREGTKEGGREGGVGLQRGGEKKRKLEMTVCDSYSRREGGREGGKDRDVLR